MHSEFKIKLSSTHIFLAALVILTIVVSLLNWILSLKQDNVEYTSLQKPTNIPVVENQKKEDIYISQNLGFIEREDIDTYQVTNSIENLAKTLTQHFSISTNPKIYDFGYELTSWTEGSKTIYLQDNPAYFSYKNATTSQNKFSDESLNKAKDLFFNTISDLNLISSNIQAQIKTTKFLNYQGGEPAETKNLSSATHIKIDAVYTINNLPVILSPQTNYSISMEINTENQITSISGHALHINDSAIVRIISQNEAQNQLRNNQGFLINTEVVNSYYGISDINFEQVEIDNTSLGYLYDKSTNNLVPIYIYDGTTKPSSDFPYQYNLTYIIPASN